MAVEIQPLTQIRQSLILSPENLGWKGAVSMVSPQGFQGFKVETLDFGVGETCVTTLALPLTSCVTLNYQFTFLSLSFPDL